MAVAAAIGTPFTPISPGLRKDRAAMIPYVRHLDPRYGEAVQVSPLIRRAVANNPSAFTYLGTGTYIVGQGEVAVIDPGPDLPEHLDAIMRAVEASV